MRKKIIHAADLFCGAGGTSSGLCDAAALLGLDLHLTAVNHWETAIATHTTNHPTARHRCASLDSLNPRDLFDRDSLKLLWASPECTHHSTARGGMPINDQSRSTAFCVTRWAESLRPEIILIENVPEFRTWGPLKRVRKRHPKTGKMQWVMRPDPARKGEIFHSWIHMMESIGYVIEYRVFCAADYGDPTTRQRLFIQAHRIDTGRRIVWPNPTHAEDPAPGTGLLKWRSARDHVVDWSIVGTSIFDRPAPLKPKTMRRIFTGIRRQGAEPLIISMEHGGRLDSIDSPLRTITTARGGAMALATPFIVELRGTSDRQVEQSTKPIDSPLGTVTAGGRHHGIATPFIIQVAHGASANGDESRRVKSIDCPLPTICGNRGDMAIIVPFLLGQQSGSAPRPVTEPAPTVAAAGAISLIDPFLVKFYGTANDASIDDPCPTVTAKDRLGIATPITTTTDTITVHAIIQIGDEIYPLSRIDHPEHGTIHCLIVRTATGIALMGILFRMLKPHELAAAQGFHPTHKFSGTQTEQVKQIGNAVPRRMARALALAALSQKPNISSILYPAQTSAA